MSFQSECPHLLGMETVVRVKAALSELCLRCAGHPRVPCVSPAEVLAVCPVLPWCLAWWSPLWPSKGRPSLLLLLLQQVPAPFPLTHCLSSCFLDVATWDSHSHPPDPRAGALLPSVHQKGAHGWENKQVDGRVVR